MRLTYKGKTYRVKQSVVDTIDGIITCLVIGVILASFMIVFVIENFMLK